MVYETASIIFRASAAKWFTNVYVDNAEWEAKFCMPFYRGGYRDMNTAYMEAHSLIAGEGEDLLGIYVVTANSEWPGMNVAIVSEPVADAVSLRSRIERAAAYYRALGLSWTFVVNEDWVAPALRDAVPELCREFMLNRGAEAFGMAGRVTRRPVPEGLDMRRVATPEMWREFADINAESWDLPVEWTRRIVEPDAPWKEHADAFACYVDGEAVSVVMAYPVQGTTYLSWGATRVAHRKKGYGEAVLRHTALQQAGGPDATLLASRMGVKPWRAAGLEIVSKFSFYVSAGKTG